MAGSRRLVAGWMGALAVLLTLGGAVEAQPERYELGRRLRLFEAAFEQETDPAKRARTYPPMNVAVQSFFSLRLGEAGRAMDEARRHLLPLPPTADERWAEALYLVVEPRLYDAERCEVAFQLKAFYPPGGSPPAGAVLRFAHLLPDGQRQPIHSMLPVRDLPLKGTLVFTDLAEGDGRLEYEVYDDAAQKVLVRGTIGVSFVKDLESRLTALQAALEALPAGKSVEESTARTLAQLLRNLTRKQSPETDFPAARLLREAEEAVAAAQSEQSYFGQGKSGQFWLTLLTGRTRTAIRVMAPPQAESRQPLPLVLALHGAGGSENMFFDTYGHGKIVDLCRERGWLLVAPRSGGFGSAPLSEVIDEVKKLYPVATERVYVVGHSMGAAQALMNVRQTPERFAAVAVLGGGRPVQVSEAMKKGGCFVGVGAKGFA
ncbi:MAG TPA: alpha/beta fold hydrolase, partial [Gemmatales bacterium]|nr:alpha/beta fold hydrolase [Gemmatales bacterium]